GARGRGCSGRGASSRAAGRPARQAERAWGEPGAGSSSRGRSSGGPPRRKARKEDGQELRPCVPAPFRSLIAPPGSPPAARRPRLRGIARGALIALGVPLAAAVASGVVLARRAAAIVHARAVAEAERIGARIGRAVTVGPAHVTLGAELVIQLDD